jgi:hypothetical protein
MEKEKSIQIAISVKPKLLSFMKEVAETRGVGFSEMLRTAFERYYFEIYSREKAGYGGADKLAKNRIKAVKKDQEFEFEQMFGPGTEDRELSIYLRSLGYINPDFEERNNSDLYIDSIEDNSIKTRGLVAKNRTTGASFLYLNMEDLKQNVVEFISNKK